jgi:cell division protein FtsW (lipid II flippase)
MDKVNDVTAVVAPVGLVLGGLVGLTLLQPDFGTSAFLIMLAVVMIFAAGLHYRYLIGVALCGLPAAAALILLSGRRSERIERIMTWIDPWSDPPAAASRSSSRSSPSARAASPAAASCRGCRRSASCRSRTPTSSTPSSARSSG